MRLLTLLSVAILLHATGGQIYSVIPQRFQCQSLFNFYPHETDCNRFYRCFWGQAHEFVCPINTHWNQRILTCDHAYNVPCATAIVAQPIFQDWQPINSGFVKSEVLPRQTFETSFVKETVAHSPTLIGGQEFKNIIPAYHSSVINAPVVKAPFPSGHVTTKVDTGFVRKDEYAVTNQNDFANQNTGFVKQSNVFPGQNTGYLPPNNQFPTQNIFPRQTGFPTQNNGVQNPGFLSNNARFPAQNNGYLHNFRNQPYRKSMWHASAGTTDERFRKSQFLSNNRDLGFGGNNVRPNIKFVKVQDPVVGRFFGSKGWKK